MSSPPPGPGLIVSPNDTDGIRSSATSKVFDLKQNLERGFKLIRIITVVDRKTLFSLKR